MALTSALKDRARIVRNTATGQRIEGKSHFTAVPGPWFKARLELGSGPEGDDPGGTSRAVIRPTLLVGIRDLAGGSLIAVGGGSVIRATDYIEVSSPQLGSVVWDVTGDPRPIRKRRRVIGFEVDLERIEYHPKG